MINSIRSGIKQLVNQLGWELRRKPRVENGGECFTISEQMKAGLFRISRNDIPINTIIDVGAACGTWSLASQVHWPDCNYLLLEPLMERKEVLSAFVSKNNKAHLVLKAAGNTSQKMKFFVSEDLDGSGIAKDTDQRVREVDLTTIDSEVNKLELEGPFMIKLDTHGFEIPILEGCRSILKSVSIFVIECYGFRITKDSLLFAEMCIHMDKLGFRLIDVVDVINRPIDGAFWQCDAFFVRKTLPFYQSTSYN